VELAEQLQYFARSERLDYRGPLEVADSEALGEALRQLQKHAHPTLLHLRIAPASHASSLDRPVGVPALAGGLGEQAEAWTPTGQERRNILDRPIPQALQRWLRAYQRVGERGLYLWKWCLYGIELTTLPCVAASLRGANGEAKFLAAMVNVLVDDVSDKAGNARLLAALLRRLQGGPLELADLSRGEREYARLTARVWTAVWREVERFPRYAEFKELLEYDFAQLFNTVRYSQLVRNNLYALNIEEHDLYSPHGMMLMIFATLDLMGSPGFRREEVGRLREAIWHAEWMARIGNLISTWERELADGDYTSGVFAQAIAAGDLTVADLEAGRADRIKEAIERNRYEARYLRRWRHHRERIEAMRPKLRSVDLGHVLEGLDRLLRTELESRGLK
jgi:hypothetical protein